MQKRHQAACNDPSSFQSRADGADAASPARADPHNQSFSQHQAPAADRSNPARAGRKRLSILGATGSIGTSTLDLVERNRHDFQIVALTAHSNVAKLADLAIRYHAELAVIGDDSLYGQLRDRLAGTAIEVAAGAEGLCEAGARRADCIMAAIMGAAGLKPTLAAVAQGTRLALANKECLVSAGDVFMRAVAAANTELLPVDSEHSAAFQALTGADPDGIERIVLTASGGPFRTFNLTDLATVTPEQALKHPNWEMGRKISIDSATMMNKGLELIEAYHLFPVSIEQLSTIVHPQSIVHCLVEYKDGSVLAQLASPDMRTPIAYALSWPRRMEAPTERLDLTKHGTLTFEAADEARFPALRVAREALVTGGAAPAILNAANEVAVEAFLSRRLKFLDIAHLVADTLEEAEKRNILAATTTLEAVLAIDETARHLARDLLTRYC